MENMNNFLLPDSIVYSSDKKYTILKELKHSDYSITYLATSTDDNDTVTVVLEELFLSALCWRDDSGSKMCYAPAVNEEVQMSVQHFVRTAQQLKQLVEGPYKVAKVKEVFQTNGTAYCVMEHVEGETLEEYVKSKGKLTDEEMTVLLRPIAETMATLHASGFAHYNITPGNIILEKSGDEIRPVLTSFALARLYKSENLSKTVVTPGYAPIEQSAGIEKFSPYFDTYALGATAYFCLLGEHPCVAAEFDVAAIRNNIKGRTGKAVVHAMSKYSNHRTYDASNFVNDLWDNNGRNVLAWVVLAVAVLILFGLLRSNNTAEESENEVVEIEEPQYPYHLFPVNFDLAVTRNDSVLYFDSDHWDWLPAKERKEYTKLGIVVAGNGIRFLLNLNDSDGYSYKDALAKFGDRIPTKEQEEVINKNCKVIDRALMTFGGKTLSYFYVRKKSRFWNVVEKCSTSLRSA